MPSILSVPINNHSSTLEVRLWKEGLFVDPRVIFHDNNLRFQCIIEGLILKFKHVVIAVENDSGACDWRALDKLHFRLYDSSVEKIPAFDSKTYRYHGLKYEKPPFDVVDVVIDSSVKAIPGSPFLYCNMKRCIMEDSVKTLGYANGCSTVKHIRLSRGLECISNHAFVKCEAMECLFVPPNVKTIEAEAFAWCTSMKILILPMDIDIDQIGDFIVMCCSKLLTNDAVRYKIGNGWKSTNYLEVNKWLKHRYDHLPLIRLCADPDITVQRIHEFIQDNGTAAFHQTDDDHGLLPLHILTRYNGFADEDVIMTCFEANPNALFVQDMEGLTPLNNLWNCHKLDVIISLIQDLCVKWYIDIPSVHSTAL